MNLGEYLGAGTALTAGLYHLNGNANDSSGNGFNLSLVNSPTSIEEKFGGGYSLNGTNQQINLGSNLGVNGANPITLSIWVKPTNADPGGGRNIISLSTTSGNNFFAIWYDKSTWSGGTISLVFTRNRDTTGTDQVVYNVTLPTTEWSHVALTYDGSTVRGFLNGVQVASVASSGSGGGSDKGNLFALGFYHIWYWAGGLDEAIVDKRQWSNIEVQQYYTMGKGRFGIL